MNIEKAICIVDEWMDEEGISDVNSTELGIFLGLIRASSEDFKNEKINEDLIESRIYKISLAIFQLGRAVGRPNYPERFGDLE